MIPYLTHVSELKSHVFKLHFPKAWLSWWRYLLSAMDAFFAYGYNVFTQDRKLESRPKEERTILNMVNVRAIERMALFELAGFGNRFRLIRNG